MPREKQYSLKLTFDHFKRKYQSVQRQYPNTFTEVYLNNLVHLVESDKKMSGATFLPDLQELVPIR
jgi:hypothetical protein